VSKHFLAQPEDEVGAGGAPVLFATHVLGHYLLAQELSKDLLQPLSSAAAGAVDRKIAGGQPPWQPLSLAAPARNSRRLSRASGLADTVDVEDATSAALEDMASAAFNFIVGDDSATAFYPHKPLVLSDADSISSRRGRVVWTSSRAATARWLDMERLAPPSLTVSNGRATITGCSGLEAAHRSGKASVGEAYGEAKYFLDLLNAAVGDHPERLNHVPSFCICPGFVDTDMSPAFFKLFIPFMKVVRCYADGFNITGERGAHASITAAVRPAGLLRADQKYVMEDGQLVPAQLNRGTFPLPWKLREAAYRTTSEWTKVWRAVAAKDAPAAAAGAKTPLALPVAGTPRGRTGAAATPALTSPLASPLASPAPGSASGRIRGRSMEARKAKPKTPQ
jgi:NAD(P)-dependent dehydrogenase (short-subunit alcohol dehydrogenase family)